MSKQPGKQDFVKMKSSRNSQAISLKQLLLGPENGKINYLTGVFRMELRQGSKKAETNRAHAQVSFSLFSVSY
ncbi:hypothetical protein [Maridesulfovibrio sp.]|uniref:hypothetical protein n=1 Tax=Maridesulfovibrio sp. TaxID=2795000 RepID=UPI002A18CB3A|nr:hypothetical protein [Maridesulfovibrio sp.]